MALNATNEDPTVEEYILKYCSESLFEELANKEPYWQQCHQFWNKNRERKVSSLSFKQKQWLAGIKEGLLKAAIGF